MPRVRKGQALREAASRGKAATEEIVPMELNEVIPWGRSFDEYRRMFDLSAADLAGRVLGCGDGPASFNAEATEAGFRVTSCDPIYAFSAEEIRRRVERCYDNILAQVRRDQDQFVWNDFDDPEALGRARLATMERFLGDYPLGKAEGRHVTASLPDLPFENGRFDLALCSHLLFLYSEPLSFAFHLAAIEELSRVAGEVRIFPLLRLDRRPSQHLEPLRRDLDARGWTTEIRTVAYEFQRGGNQMLRVARGVESA